MKFLFQVNYTRDGLEGVIKDGGTGRQKAAAQLMESLGGHLESLYFAFGDVDAYVTDDLPDVEAATAAALRVGQTGAVTARTIVLLEPSQVDAATTRELSYSPPGS